MSSLTELQALIQEKYDIPVSDLDPQASMREKGLDSLALAEFIFAVEDHFHIVVPDDNPNIDTLAELASLVDGAIAAKEAKETKETKAESTV
ncbi:MAG: acyl carrier protein [Variovorax sp.]|jgi:acyl carrier protein|nr:MAG: acyl carrier protein [Variovorax sp.]